MNIWGRDLSHLLKSKKITTNLINPYIISVLFWTCFFSPFSSFNDEKITKSESQLVTMVTFNHMIKNKITVPLT